MGFTKAKSQTRTTNTTMTTRQEGTASSQKPEQPNPEQTKERIVEALRSAGGRLTRADLIAQLDLESSRDSYRDAEQALVDDKRIERRRGRTGGIYLLPEDDQQRQSNHESATATANESLRREQDYYASVLEEIKDHWAEEQGFKAVFGSVTAMQGRRPTGGRWSRPDITLCTVSEWIFSSRPEGEVRTIEVKLFDDKLDIIGVYEALAHKSRSHYSYLMIVDFPEKELNSDQKQDFDKIKVAAASHGIGIITVPKSDDWSTWEFVLEPTRSDADHQEINQFLLDQFPRSEREKFKKKIRKVCNMT